jgi:hypothetical protein
MIKNIMLGIIWVPVVMSLVLGITMALVHILSSIVNPLEAIIMAIAAWVVLSAIVRAVRSYR